MRFFLFLFFSYAFVLPIGVDGFYFPTNAQSFSLSSGLVAWPYNYSQNPAILSGYKNEEISFSYNSYFGGMEGQNFGIVFGKDMKKSLELTKWSIDGFDLRDEIPSEDPLGEFGASFLSARFSSAFKIGANKSFGIRLCQYHYSLYDRNVYGSNLSAGYHMLIHKLSLGFAINSFGVLSNDNIIHNPIIIVGFNYNFNKIKSDLILSFRSFLDEEEFKNSKLLTLGFIKHFTFGKLYLSISDDIVNSKEIVAKLALGAEIDVGSWKLRYGFQKSSNTVIGNPQSIELVYIF